MNPRPKQSYVKLTQPSLGDQVLQTKLLANCLDILQVGRVLLFAGTTAVVLADAFARSRCYDGLQAF